MVEEGSAWPPTHVIRVRNGDAAAGGGELERDRVAGGDGLFVDDQMLGVFAAVVGVLPELDVPAAAVEEIELHGDLARLAVGHRAEDTSASPDCRTITRCSPTAPSSTRVSSHTVGTIFRKSAPGWSRRLSGCSQTQQTGLS